jgi:hypothetical protein
MGEPLGECVTRKEGGRIIYGGGDSAPATQTQVSDLPEWARGTAQKTLGLAESLTDISKNPYQSYGGQRSAQFTDLQKQAYGNAMGMNAGPQGFAQNVGAYMSPYMQNVVDREKMAAARDSQILGQQQQAGATQAGAFGGYREGIQRAERERGLRSSLQDIQARGTQAAYDQAANQFRQGIGQQLAVNQQQGAFGTQQQQNVQNMLDTQYQDFLNQKKYPYQQLEFMSNMLRGTPMGTVNTLYGAGPTMGQQVGALGMGMYGYNQMFGGKNAADGGIMESYADGGVTGDQFVESAIRRLSDAQLQREMQEAAQARDQAKLAMLQSEASRRAQARESNGGGAGLSSLFSEQMADNVMPTEESMARGGIVAFADRGLVDDEEGSEGSPADFQYFLNRGKKLFAEMDAVPGYTAMTPAEQAKARAAYMKEVQEGAGESPYAKRLEGINAERAALSGNLEQAKGIGALRAAAAMLQGRGFMRGLGNAGEAFAATYEKAESANRAENRALRDMEFNLLDAQRKERMGLNKEATDAMREVERDRAAAAKHRKDGLAAQANLARGMAAAAKPGKSGSGAASKVPERLADARLAYAKNPTPENLAAVEALRQTAYDTRTTYSTSEVGPTRAGLMGEATDAGTEAKILKFVDDNLTLDRAYRNAARMAEGPERDRAIAAAVQGLRAQALASIGRGGAPARNVNSNSTAGANSATVEGLPPGATVRGNQVFDRTGKFIGRVE